MATSLDLALADGACLINSDHSTPALDLKSSLEHRLARYYARVGSGNLPLPVSLDEIQLITAKEALSVVGRIQRILNIGDPDEGQIGARNDNHQSPLIGTRDLTEIRTLLSIIFKWGINPLMNKFSSSWVDQNRFNAPPRIIELSMSSDYAHLASMSCHLMDLLFPQEAIMRVSETLISVSIFNRHLTDILWPCIALGWLPKSLASGSTLPIHAMRPRVMRLLTLLPPSQIISAIGNILSSSAILPAYTRKTCSILLSQQLLRPQGIEGLCAAVFGEGDSSTDDTPIEKLEHVVRVLITAPSILDAQTYFRAMIPRIVKFLVPIETPVHRRVASSSISRMLSDGTFKHHNITSPIILNILHRPFRDDYLELGPSSLHPLYSLMTLTSNTDPSPPFISALLTPIIPGLYSVLHHMDKIKTSDPSLQESLRGLLVTWGKIINTPEGNKTLWSIIEHGEASWKLDPDGQVHKHDSEKPDGLTLVTPEDFRRVSELNVDANILELYPDPVHFVQLLRDIDNAEISSDIFIKSLEAYRLYKAMDKADPTRTLLHLQMIIQMQTQLLDVKSSKIVLKPVHLLGFVKDTLNPLPAQPPDPIDLRTSDTSFHVPLFQGDRLLEDPCDSDDDTPGSEILSADNEMVETCLNLLLSILEANSDLSARTMPILNDIFSLLEPFARDGATSIRPLAQEARMVMTARLASSSTEPFARDAGNDSAEEVYQKALKLLQDPILPVRAHGLLLLRQLVLPSYGKEKKTRLANRALVPAILSIFLQAIHDDDSYIYMNGIQGLAAMVETFGKDLLQGLIREYTEGLDGLGSTSLTQRNVDSKIKVGEALGLVIRRCGEMLGIHLDVLVPSFLIIVRSRHLPTVLRASSLSLLAECEITNPSAMLLYVFDLAEAMIDLLQLETTSNALENSEFEPTSKNTKLPPLRRAALHLLSLIFRETITIYDSTLGSFVFSGSFVERARTTLSYVASTDGDVVVRVMAREAAEILGQMQKVILGL